MKPCQSLQPNVDLQHSREAGACFHIPLFKNCVLGVYVCADACRSQKTTSGIFFRAIYLQF